MATKKTDLLESPPFGKLLVIARGEVTKSRQQRWVCECECGDFTDRPTTTDLLLHRSESCGCANPHHARNIKDQPFGKLTAKSRVYGSKPIKWWCDCACGNRVAVRLSNLHSGLSLSCGCKWKLPRGLAAKRRLLRTYRNSARHRGYAWEIAEEPFIELIAMPCSYCGKAPSQVCRRDEADTGECVYNGIDRVDNARGYIHGNVVPCCGTCNVAKAAMSLPEFLDWVARVHSHRKLGESGQAAKDVAAA